MQPSPLESESRKLAWSVPTGATSPQLTIIGRNYYSYLLGLCYLDQNLRPFIIDDPNVQYGPHFLGDLSELERASLMHMGHTLDVAPLIDLDHYLKPKPFMLNMGPVTLRMGQTWSANVREFLRKVIAQEREDLETWREVYTLLNSYQGKEYELDQELNSFVQSMLERHIPWRGGAQAVHQAGPLRFQDIPKSIQALGYWAQSAQGPLRKVLGMASEYLNLMVMPTQGNLFTLKPEGPKFLERSIGMIEGEQLGPILSLFAPRYQLDYEVLSKDLHRTYVQRGGRIHRSGISHWQFENSRVIRLQLDSFEGIVEQRDELGKNAGQIMFMGRPPGNYPIFFKTRGAHAPEKHLVSFMLTLKPALSLQSKLMHLAHQRFVFAPVKRLGMDLAWWEMNIDHAGLVHGLFYYPEDHGARPSFFVSVAYELLKSSLESYLGKELETSEFEQMELNQAQDEWTNPLQRANSLMAQSYQKVCFGTQGPEFLKKEAPDEHSALSGIHYLGPLSRCYGGKVGLILGPLGGRTSPKTPPQP